MPEYLAPGVFVEEIAGPRPIEAVGTSTAVFIGLAEKGPVNEPILVTSFGDFQRKFGSYFTFTSGTSSKKAFLAYSVKAFFDNGGSRCYIVRVTIVNASGVSTAVASVNTATIPDHITSVTAISPGEWGDSIRYAIEPLLIPNPVKPDYFNLRVLYDPDGLIAAAGNTQSLVDNAKKLTTVELFENCTFNENDTNFIENLVNNKSAYISIEASHFEGAAVTSTIATYDLDGGINGVDGITTNAFSGEASGARWGLQALDKITLVNIISIPDIFNVDDTALIKSFYQSKAIAYIDGSSRRDSILIIDPLENLAISGTGSITDYRGNLNSNNAVLYYPWVKITDPQTGNIMKLPPSGAAAGIMARTDSNRGVFKAPAGTIDGVLRGTVGLESQITKGEQEVLNPLGINVLRNIPGAGDVIWGTRTLSVDPQWRYLPVRRLILYIEKSLEKASWYAVFEPNDFYLWSNIRRDFSAFLRTVWREGGLFGAKEEDAFFVKVDSENNPPESRDLGRLIINVGVAPVKPAEFVILRIEQKTLEK